MSVLLTFYFIYSIYALHTVAIGWPVVCNCGIFCSFALFIDPITLDSRFVCEQVSSDNNILVSLKCFCTIFLGW